MKAEIMALLLIICTPILAVVTVQFGLSGLRYGVIYPIGVVSFFYSVLALYWITAIPELSFVLVRRRRPEGNKVQQYKSYNNILVVILFLTGFLMMTGFTREALGEHGSKLGVYLFMCLVSLGLGLWYVWYCTFRSGWVAKMSYSDQGMSCRYGAKYYEIADLRYIHDGRNNWMPVVRIGALWRAMGETGSYSLQTFEYKVSRSLFPKMDVDHFVETMTSLLPNGVEAGQCGR